MKPLLVRVQDGPCLSLSIYRINFPTIIEKAGRIIVVEHKIFYLGLIELICIIDCRSREWKFVAIVRRNEQLSVIILYLLSIKS